MNSNTKVVTNFLSPWDKYQRQNEKTSHDFLPMYKQPKVPQSFIWKDLDHDISQPKEKFNPEVIDLEGFIKGDKLATQHAANLLKKACLEHGFFRVINHGVDSKLLNQALARYDDLFKLPPSEKLRVLRDPKTGWGFSKAHADRFSTNLAWKEFFSFPFHAKDSNNEVVDYFTSVLGSDLEPMGKVYQKYSEAMMELCSRILELLAISLGVEQNYYKDFFGDALATVRCNYYPPCELPSHVLGTGPHCDPTSVTILHQDQVGGLEIFYNNKWQAVQPCPDALIVNMGDTFKALSNGIYKSCLHRAVVNDSSERKSIAFFLSPRPDKVVRPAQSLSNPRKYPDFTWSDLQVFTHGHYRADPDTLENFFKWFNPSKTEATP